MSHRRTDPIGPMWSEILRQVAASGLITTEGLAERLYPAVKDHRPRARRHCVANPPHGEIFPSRAALRTVLLAAVKMQRAGYLRRARPWTEGQLWATDEAGRAMLALMVERAKGRRHYKTDRVRRLKAKSRRDDLRRDGYCINGQSHGRAKRGCRCDACHDTHKRSA